MFALYVVKIVDLEKGHITDTAMLRVVAFCHS